MYINRHPQAISLCIKGISKADSGHFIVGMDACNKDKFWGEKEIEEELGRQRKPSLHQLKETHWLIRATSPLHHEA
eukprot:1154634-Pelagomonas_calceolata.AAC.3